MVSHRSKEWRTPRPCTPYICPNCGHNIKLRAKIGRTTCSKCQNPFIYDYDLWIKHTRDYAHKPEVYAKRKKWEKENAQHLRELHRIRYSKKKDRINMLQKPIQERLRGVSAKTLDGDCEICGKRSGKMARHHVIPKVIGGENSVENLIRVCQSCHVKLERNVVLMFGSEYREKFKEFTNKCIEGMKNEIR